MREAPTKQVPSTYQTPMTPLDSHADAAPDAAAETPAVVTSGAAAQYGLLGLPLAFVALPVYVHLPHFYAQQFGLSLSLLGLILLATRCLDGFVDPWLGRAADTLYRHSWQRVAGVASVLACALALGFVALFLPPETGLSMNERVVWLVGALVLSHLAYSGLGVLHQAWAARQGGGEVAQSRWVTWREGLGLLGVLMATTLPSLVGWLVTSVVLCALLAIGLRAWLRGAGGRVGDRFEQNQTARGALWPLRYPAFRRLLAVFIVNGFASAIPATLVLFFVQDALQAPASWEPLFLGLYFVSGALSLPLWLKAVARFGLAKTWRLGMLLSIAAFIGVLMLGQGDAVWFLLICMTSGLALGADLAVPGALLNRLIDASGERQKSDGAFVGWWHFATKLNLALAAGLSLPLLDWLGYAPGQQDAQALSALLVAYGLIPCVLKGLAAFAATRWLIADKLQLR